MSHYCNIRLACVKRLASVHPEPGSNSSQKIHTKFAVQIPRGCFSATMKVLSLTLKIGLFTCILVKISLHTSSYGGTHLRSRLRMQQVVSAEKGLTAVFGMGTGISPSRISTTIDTSIEL